MEELERELEGTIFWSWNQRKPRRRKIRGGPTTNDTATQRVLAPSDAVSVILVPVNHETADLQLNWWIWRTVLAELKRSNLVSEEQFERMSGNGSGGAASADDCDMFGRHLEEVVRLLKSGDRLLADGTVTDEPHSHELDMAPNASHKNYSATAEHLQLFIDFCKTCAGFTVV